VGAILPGPTYRKSNRVRRNQKYLTYTDERRNNRSEERVRKAVIGVKNGKSCRPEGVYAEMLEHGTDKLIKMLTWVINRCLNGEEAPQQWKVAYISSIHKKGSKKYCANCRGISVTRVMSRL
jgi:hypothetical protein